MTRMTHRQILNDQNPKLLNQERERVSAMPLSEELSLTTCEGLLTTVAEQHNTWVVLPAWLQIFHAGGHVCCLVVLSGICSTSVGRATIWWAAAGNTNSQHQSPLSLAETHKKGHDLNPKP